MGSDGAAKFLANFQTKTGPSAILPPAWRLPRNLPACSKSVLTHTPAHIHVHTCHGQDYRLGSLTPQSSGTLDMQRCATELLVIGLTLDADRDTAMVPYPLQANHNGGGVFTVLLSITDTLQPETTMLDTSLVTK